MLKIFVYGIMIIAFGHNHFLFLKDPELQGETVTGMEDSYLIDVYAIKDSMGLSVNTKTNASKMKIAEDSATASISKLRLTRNDSVSAREEPSDINVLNVSFYYDRI